MLVEVFLFFFTFYILRYSVLYCFNMIIKSRFISTLNKLLVLCGFTLHYKHVLFWEYNGCAHLL